MEADLAQGKIGSVGDFELDLKDGKFVLKAGVKPTEGVKLASELEVDALVFVDKLAALIPGQVDDAIFGVLKAALIAK